MTLIKNKNLLNDNLKFKKQKMLNCSNKLYKKKLPLL